MSDWTEEAVRAAVARLEAQGVAQDAEAPRPTPTKKRAAPQKPAQALAGASDEGSAKLGTEAGMHALWRAALAEHGPDIPALTPEYHFAQPWRQWRFDYAYPPARVAVELDGMAWQAGGGHHNHDDDRFKANSAAALGWRVLRFTSRALRTDPAGCVALVRRALEAA